MFTFNVIAESKRCVNITETVLTLEQRIIGTIRLKHYSRKTEMSYVQWYKRYVHFQKEVCGKMRHPAEMGAPEVEAFLTHLAVNRDLAAASQNQVLNALEPLGSPLNIQLFASFSPSISQDKTLDYCLTKRSSSAKKG